MQSKLISSVMADLLALRVLCRLPAFNPAKGLVIIPCARRVLVAHRLLPESCWLPVNHSVNSSSLEASMICTNAQFPSWFGAVRK